MDAFLAEFRLGPYACDMSLAFEPAFAAEFPNDNPALHAGVSWVCLRVSGPPRPVARPRAAERVCEMQVVADAPAVAAAVPTVMESAESERLPESVLGLLLEKLDLELTPPIADDAAVQAAILEAPGLTEAPEVASAVPTMTVVTSPALDACEAERSRAPREDPFATLVSALVGVALDAGATRAAAVIPDLLCHGTLDASSFAADVRASLDIARVTREAVPSEEFLGAAGAWRAILRGESSDFSACGPKTLDEWATALLRAFGVGGGKTDLRLALRARGVAAFGMLTAAA